MSTTNTTPPKAAEKDSVVTPFSGLEELSQQTYEIPFTELAPHLQLDIQTRAKRLAAEEMLAALKAVVAHEDKAAADIRAMVAETPELSWMPQVRAAIAKYEGQAK